MTLNGHTILSAHRILLLEQCKVHADICGGSMVRGPQTILEWSEPLFFLLFSVSMSSEPLEVKLYYYAVS